MWELTADRKTVRLRVPPVRLMGLPKPVDMHFDFDAEAVDNVLVRLTLLRAKMLPPRRSH
jgi:hypothetical protein